jgi:hypothetical protein
MMRTVIEKAPDVTHHFLRTILWIFLFINVLSLILYQFGNMKSDFYHEATFPLLYAKDMLDTKLLFSSDFSGREIAPISWPIVYSLLLMLGLKTSLTTVAIGNVLFLIFVLVVLVWFGITFKVNRTFILLLLVIFTTPWGTRPFRYSWMDQVWNWPMNSYGIYELFSLLLCICAYKMLLGKNVGSAMPVFLSSNKYFLLVFFIFGMNHNRGVLEIYGPVGFTLVLLTLFSYFQEGGDELRRNARVFLATFVSTLLGRILIGILTSGVPQYWQDPSQTFTSLDQSNFPTKLLSPMLTIFQVFGLTPLPGVKVSSFEGIRLGSIIVIVLILVFVPTLKYLQTSNFEKLSLPGKFMFLHLLYFILISFTTSLLTTSSGQIRYSIPLAISAIFFIPFLFSESMKKQVVLALLLVIVLVPNVVSGTLQLNRTLDIGYRESSNYELMESLLERNLTYGYAGPWTEDVSVIPFYSEGEIHISLIDVDPVGPHLHADKSWFRETNHSGRTFVAIPTVTLLKADSSQRLLISSASRYEVNKWTVLVFEENPAQLIGQLR